MLVKPNARIEGQNGEYYRKQQRNICIYFFFLSVNFKSSGVILLYTHKIWGKLLLESSMLRKSAILNAFPEIFEDIRNTYKKKTSVLAPEKSDENETWSEVIIWRTYHKIFCYIKEQNKSQAFMSSANCVSK